MSLCQLNGYIFYILTAIIWGFIKILYFIQYIKAWNNDIEKQNGTLIHCILLELSPWESSM